MAKPKTPAKRIRALLTALEAQGRRQCSNPSGGEAGASGGMEQVRAMRFASAIVSEQQHIGPQRAEFFRIADLLEAALSEFKRSHPDPDGFGHAALVNLIAQLRELGGYMVSSAGTDSAKQSRK